MHTPQEAVWTFWRTHLFEPIRQKMGWATNLLPSYKEVNKIFDKLTQKTAKMMNVKICAETNQVCLWANCELSCKMVRSRLSVPLAGCPLSCRPPFAT